MGQLYRETQVERGGGRETRERQNSLEELIYGGILDPDSCSVPSSPLFHCALGD